MSLIFLKLIYIVSGVLFLVALTVPVAAPVDTSSAIIAAAAFSALASVAATMATIATFLQSQHIKKLATEIDGQSKELAIANKRADTSEGREAGVAAEQARIELK